MELILATNNQNKLRELREILAGTGLTVISQKEAGYSLEPEESGTTFAENAAIKARALFQAAQAEGKNCWVLADDSGLSVDALNGEPGVYSHRWAGENADDAARCQKLLDVMKNVPEGERGAHFACELCLIAPDGTEHIFHGRVEGTILYAPSGENGFGYDPVFGYGGRSFAELSAEEKNAVSHRRNALEQLLRFFQEVNA